MMKRRPFKYFAKLSAEQMRRALDRCSGSGPYTAVRVESAGETATVTVRLESGERHPHAPPMDHQKENGDFVY